MPTLVADSSGFGGNGGTVDAVPVAVAFCEEGSNSSDSRIDNGNHLANPGDPRSSQPSPPNEHHHDEINSILKDVGELGGWQWFLALVNMLMTIVTGIQTNCYPLLVGTSNNWNYACKHVNNSNFSLPPETQLCKVSDSFGALSPGQGQSAVGSDATLTSDNVVTSLDCSEADGYEMVYSHEHFDKTLITEFDLMCGYGAYLAPLVHSSFTIGCFFGVLIFGYLADWVGRKSVLYFGVPIAIALNFGLAFTPNVFVFLVVRLLQGCAVFGIYTVVYVISMETTAPSKRAMIGNIVHIPWGLQFVTVSLVAMWLRDWRLQQIVSSVPSLLCLICLTPLMTESPRWLAINGKIEKATQVFVQAAKWNRREVSKQSIQERVQLFYEQSVSAKNPERNTSKVTLYLGLIKTPEMRRRFLLSTVVWFQIAFTNHGYNIYAPTLAKNPFFAYCLVGLFEFVSPIIGAFVFTYGRRVPLTFIFALCGLLSFCLIPIFKIWPENNEFQVLALVLIVSFLSDMAFNGIYVHVSEFMPTTHRSIGLGSCSSVARIGSSLSSIVAQTASTYPLMPPAIFGSISLAGSLCNFFLPSTENKQLPETIEEIENWKRRKEQKETNLSCLSPSLADFDENNKGSNV